MIHFNLERVNEYDTNGVMIKSTRYTNGLISEVRELLRYKWSNDDQSTICIISYANGKKNGVLVYANADTDLTPVSFIRFEYWINDNVICNSDRQIQYYIDNHIIKYDQFIMICIKNRKYNFLLEHYANDTPVRICQYGKSVHELNDKINFSILLRKINS
jgi:hypothetical protein